MTLSCLGGPLLTPHSGLDFLNTSARTAQGGRSSQFWPKTLVTSQVMLSLLLLVGAGLLLRTLRKLFAGLRALVPVMTCRLPKPSSVSQMRVEGFIGDKQTVRGDEDNPRRAPKFALAEREQDDKRQGAHHEQKRHVQFGCSCE